MGKFLKPLEAGLRFGRLTTTGVYKTTFKEGNHLRGKDECICDCGKITYVRRTYLLDGRIQSCGCLQKQRLNESKIKHGDVNTRFYKIRDGMICRCSNKNRKDRNRYGGRGITVCDERKTYENFKKDMFDKYNDFATIHGEHNISIDRIDSNKGYYKENCRRATPKEQANNTRRNFKVTYNNKEYNSLALLLDELGLYDKYKTIWRRIKQWGRSVEDAIAKEGVLINK